MSFLIKLFIKWPLILALAYQGSKLFIDYRGDNTEQEQEVPEGWWAYCIYEVRKSNEKRKEAARARRIAWMKKSCSKVMGELAHRIKKFRKLLECHVDRASGSK